MTGPRYERVPASTDVRRSYSIVVGVAPGYGRVADSAGAAETLPRMIEAHAEWMTTRAVGGLPVLTGVFSHGRVSYIHGTTPATEFVVTFAGEVSVLYASRVDDAQAVDMLHDLAAALAAVADQSRVYVTYRDTAWVMERHTESDSMVVDPVGDESTPALPAA